jgi:exodeoxyribonuclease III
MSITLATWNVNSVRARLPNVLAWLKSFSPDIVLLQELKCEEGVFPAMEFEELGYNLAIFGQKTYNGVAILSKYPLSDITRGLPTFPEDDTARYIEAVVEIGKREQRAESKENNTALRFLRSAPSILRVVSIYVPNGGEVGSDKFAYKLKFLERLREHAATLLTYDEPLVLGADYNVAPMDVDVYAPAALRNTTCFHPEEQRRFRTLEHLGYTDAFRARYPDTQAFSWWDYRGGGWEQNKGLRIDHLLLSPMAADALEDAGIDSAPRGEEKASDHAPVWGRFSL